MKTWVRLSLGIVLVSGVIAACFLFSSLAASPQLQEALYWVPLEKNAVQCGLCPRNCSIPKGKRGFCRARENRDGTLYTLNYAKTVAIHLDPIEKKPLFHFFPGVQAFSIATAGCNLRCKFCQNWEISQKAPEEADSQYFPPEELIKKLKASGAPVIAFTYTEPTIFYEYMLDVAKAAKKEAIKTVMHSCGYINEEPLKQLIPYLDAANIDLKGFSEEYYAKLSEATLAPVLKSLKILKEGGVHLEITNLILPGYNDDEDTLKKMCLWIKDNLGSDTPLHFSRFYPMYKLLALNATPVETLEKARSIALDCGLKYVYIGNVVGHGGEHTYCPRCKKIVIERKGYFIVQNNLQNDACKFCGESIEGIWN